MEEHQSLYAYKANAGIITRGLYGIVRFGLTALYFGILIPMLNELMLCLVSWYQVGTMPTLTDLGSAAFMMVWSPIAFGMPAFLAGLVFALLVTVFKRGVLACLITPVICVALTVFYMSGYTHMEMNVLYYLSTTMQQVSSVSAGLFGLLLSVLACTVLKSFFMPFRNPEAKRMFSVTKKSGGLTISWQKNPVRIAPALQPAG